MRVLFLGGVVLTLLGLLVLCATPTVSLGSGDPIPADAGLGSGSPPGSGTLPTTETGPPECGSGEENDGLPIDIDYVIEQIDRWFSDLLGLGRVAD